MLIDQLNSNIQLNSAAIEDNSGSGAKKELGKDDFLNLLVTQLKHQDPLNPLESVEFTAQLAQFTSVEQLFGMREALMNIQASVQNHSKENVLDYIGKEVKTSSRDIRVTNGDVSKGAYTLEEPADVTVSVFDRNGMEIRRIHAGWKDTGQHMIHWDGKSEGGVSVADGEFGFTVSAKTKDGASVEANTFTLGEVTGVIYEHGVPYLMVGDHKISQDEIIEVSAIR